MLQFFCRDTAAPNLTADTDRLLASARGGGAVACSVGSVVSGFAQLQLAGINLSWWSDPLASQTIPAQTVTWNAWAAESAATLNQGLRLLIEAWSNDGLTLRGTILDLTHGTELGTSQAVRNVGGTSTAVKVFAGDRIRVRMYAAGGVGGAGLAGGTVTANYAGPTAAALGDSYVLFATDVKLASDIVLLPPLSANDSAVLEIRVPTASQAVWNTALWDTAIWEEQQWVDVTPQAMNVQIAWGCQRPQGLLSATESGQYIVATYDPGRVLDPINAASPYHAYLRSGTPIRLRVDDGFNPARVIRTGVIDTIDYSMASKLGRISVTDGVATLANTPLPGVWPGADNDRLATRVIQSLLRGKVDESKAGGDQSLPAGVVVGEPEYTDGTVWFSIARAALDALHSIYVDPSGVIRAGSLSAPVDSLVSIGGAYGIPIEDIQTGASMEGVYTKVLTLDDGSGVLPPGAPVWQVAADQLPKYGLVEYRREREIPSAITWVTAVLADRSSDSASAQITLGTLRPRTYDELVDILDARPGETVNVFVDSISPALAVDAVVVGGGFEANTETGWSARLYAFVPVWP